MLVQMNKRESVRRLTHRRTKLSFYSAIYIGALPFIPKVVLDRFSIALINPIVPIEIKSSMSSPVLSN
jgi:hypothetical protein